ncbi:cobaltochelatase subunit CobN [Stieleria sp. TO1_6]|uniref:cobaltochelatase subunit CobN n=1 Tax=Stieleria tagensis TaxID=2956795 RepID=UPI00209B8AC1|nr:cobaltochelatase subunit CobN [Stieleria tagensis]MCO8121063.1 cobaltochelatase subunit CobN [Stieleria tagensis]
MIRNKQVRQVNLKTDAGTGSKQRTVMFRFMMGLVCWLPVQTVLAQADLAAPVVDGPPKSSAVVVVHSYLIAPARVEKLRRAAEQTGQPIEFLAMESTAADTLNSAIADSKLVLIDVPHHSVADAIIKTAGQALQSSETPYLWIGDQKEIRQGIVVKPAELLSQRGIAPDWASRVRQYYRYGGKTNTLNLAQALAGEIPAADDTDTVTAMPDPVLFPEQGFYHPDWPRIETELSAVTANFASRGKPIVAIAINRVLISSDDTEWVDAMIAALADRDLDSYAFYGPRQNSQLYTEMTCRIDDAEIKPVVNLMINGALVFRPQQRKLELDQIGVPVLQTLPALNVDAQQWQSSREGLAVEDISYYYASSELAGMVDPMLISARDQKTQLLQPITAQIEAVAARAQAICQLQRKPVDQRRIAMVVYNYPQGENNFGASFLNVPKSLDRLVVALQESGYTTEPIGADAITTKTQTALRGLYDSLALIEQQRSGAAEFLSLERYQTWFDQLPEETQNRIVDYWGTPESMALEIDGKKSDGIGFVIPGVQLGNVLVLPQPLRHEITTATDDDLRKKRINHQSTVPLSHTYLATYLYLREQWQADAVVHFGTHGTLEWAPGKQRALSIYDDPLMALGDLPNIYPYIMDNLGEATTAKRRGRATMISHLTPMFTPSGFRPGLHDMHDLMHDWETVSPGPVRRQMEKQLVESFVSHHLDRDLDWTAEQIESDFEGFMEVLHPFLDDIAQAAQPQGLAVLGQVPTPDRRFGMVMQMLRKPLIDALGEDIDEVFLLDAEKVTNSRPARWLRMALVDAESASQLDLRLIDQLDTNKHTSVPNRARDKTLDPKRLLALAKRAQQLDSMLAENNEIDAILQALNGRHVPSSYGGDPVRNPESLPTGQNLYGFDPTRVPTEQAWQIGAGVLEEWIQTYRDRHDGDFPQQIAFTMWAGETMRHQGVIESQIFHALGVRPHWNDSGRMTGFDVVPSNELDRPRIDVLLSVTGSYRDQFPHLMQWIDQAVVAVSQLDDPVADTPSGSASQANYVAEHVNALRDELESAGVAPADAARQSTARVFSNEPGGYGTGLNDAAYASDLWERQNHGGGDAEMADLFTSRMGYAYGDGLEGVAAKSLFAKQIASVDAAFLSRSSNTYGVLTSDDPFAYLGGFSLAARAAGADAPELYVQNLRDESEVIVDSAAGSIAKEMQTRYLHPQWIRSQQAEGYSGTLQVLKATQFLWGWQVTAPETIREDQWQSMMDVYVNDEYELGTREWLQEDNPQALAQILERMVDAVRLDYWQPDLETREKLLDSYDQMMRQSELIESNRQVQQFVSVQLKSKPALKPDPSVANSAELPVDPVTAAPNATPRQTTTPSADAPEFVRGQEMRPVSQPDVVGQQPQRRTLMAVVILGCVLLMGGFLQYRRLSKSQGQQS